MAPIAVLSTLPLAAHSGITDIADETRDRRHVHSRNGCEPASSAGHAGFRVAADISDSPGD